MTDIKDAQREWLARLIAELGTTATAIARSANLHPSTLTVFMNNPDAKHALSARTIARIEIATRRPFQEGTPKDIKISPSDRPTRDGFETVFPIEAEEYTDPTFQSLLKSVPEGLTLWQLNSTALSLAGYMAGDVLCVSTDLDPEPYDIVVTVHSRTSEADSFDARIYVPPFLLMASPDPVLCRPELLDNASVRIVGTVAASLRRRRSKEIT